MIKHYEVQTKFTYGWENVWRDENGNLEYFKTKEQAMKALKENVDDWNNDPNTTEIYSYDDYQVVYTDKNNNKFLVFKTLQERNKQIMRDDLMVQQQVDNAWQHMVGVICLNQTGRKKVKKVLPNFFKKFPRPDILLESDRDTIASMIKTLGMHNVKAQRIWRMSEDYLRWDGEDATQLHGIGKYGSDSYRIFYKHEIPDNVEDKELKRYIREEL